MRTQTLAVLTALVAALVIAAPTSLAPKAKYFSVKQRDSGRKILRNGPAQMARAFLKYNGTVPTAVYREAESIALAAAVGAMMTGSVAANPAPHDSEYLCSISVGTPEQSLNMDFDTGSSDL